MRGFRPFFLDGSKLVAHVVWSCFILACWIPPDEDVRRAGVGDGAGELLGSKPTLSLRAG